MLQPQSGSQIGTSSLTPVSHTHIPEQIVTLITEAPQLLAHPIQVLPILILLGQMIEVTEAPLITSILSKPLPTGP